MNRIILIGNGFDLAHGLETSYRSFIDNFWGNVIKKFRGRPSKSFDNEYFSTSDTEYIGDAGDFEDYKSFREWLEFNKIQIKFENHFLEIISDKTLENWVDIEEEYYQQIKDIVQGKSKYYKGKMAIAKLNEDFGKIKEELERYLLNDIDKPTEVKSMHNFFYDAFELKDFQSSKENLLRKYVSRVIDSATDEDLRNTLIDDVNKTINEAENKGVDLDANDLYENSKYRCLDNYPSCKFYPRKTLILNFNYTKTESLYITPPTELPNFNVKAIHVHGELGSKENPMIFGYGDELADEYKEIEKQNDKDFFRNIKSINYLQTANYKKTLSFADSDHFQIYIFGHSCGNSDRTLLNTLFEHENCVSIKPFFYEWEDKKGKKTDDYEDITINISKNFKDKASFREKVVNKTDCRPLPQKQN